MAAKRIFHTQGVFVVCGTPGSGKSHVSTQLVDNLSRRTGYKPRRFSTDRFEKAGERNDTPHSAQIRQEKYQRLAGKLDAFLSGNDHVPAVLDGTFETEEFRQFIEAVAAKHGVQVHYVHVDGGSLAGRANRLERAEKRGLTRWGSCLTARHLREHGQSAWKFQPLKARYHRLGNNQETSEKALGKRVDALAQKIQDDFTAPYMGRELIRRFQGGLRSSPESPDRALGDFLEKIHE